MADVRDVCTDALRELGVIAADDTPTASDVMSALRALNRLLDQWAAERLMIYTVSRTTFALSSGDQSYTVGSGGNFNVARPVRIDHFTIYDDTEATPDEQSLEELTDDAYALIRQKTATGPEPIYYYYNPTFPTGTLFLWPSPTSDDLTGALYAPQQVSEFAETPAGLDTAISLPPGYRRMLVKNLAMELAPSFERSPTPELREQAADSKSIVKLANVRMMDMSVDPGWLSGGGYRFDIYQG